MSAEPPTPCKLRRFGLEDYAVMLARMQDFSKTRGPRSTDELWLLQHEPVFTLGQAGKPEHVLDPGDIPVLRSDRGGQVTYHGPGQLVAYVLVDLRRRGLGVRRLVDLIEHSVLAVLASYGIEGETRRDAPGVYVGGEKIAALGLRVRGGCSYHGLSFNIDMDLSPFTRINPCGYPGLRATMLSSLLDRRRDAGLFAEAEEKLLRELLANLL